MHTHTTFSSESHARNLKCFCITLQSAVSILYPVCSLQSAFYTIPAVCSLKFIPSLQYAICSLHWYWPMTQVNIVNQANSANCRVDYVIKTISESFYGSAPVWLSPSKTNVTFCSLTCISTAKLVKWSQLQWVQVLVQLITLQPFFDQEPLCGLLF